MKPYLSVLRIRSLVLLQYRMAAFAGMCTQILFGWVRVMILEGFYTSSTALQPMSYAQAVTYIWLGQAMLRMLPWDGDLEIQAMIRKGDLAYELCRPLGLYEHWFARAIALRTAPTLIRALPVFAFAFFLLPGPYRMQPPPGWLEMGAWVLTSVGALLLSAAITNIINISMLWTISGEGVLRLLPALVLIFSGMIVPLPLLPEWSQAVLRFLPFSGLVDTPSRFYLGHLPVSQLPGYLGTQLAWTGLLVALGRWLLHRGMKRVVVQGG
ncbi:MAG: ABC-2 family transporter protein [bacterium]|nr:ABC-2 family transporter protein [bacterium]